MSRPALLVLATAVLVTAGCRGGTPAAQPSATASLPVINSGEPSARPGWTTYAKHGVSFSYPGTWTVTERTTRNGPLVEISGPKGVGELPRQIVLAGQEDFRGDLDGLVTAFEFLRSLPSQAVVRDERVALDGAAEARLTERTWQAPSVAGSTPARVVEIRLITGDRRSIAFLVRSAEADFDRSDLRAIFATLRVTSR